ncbi:TetR/AcrR family transcriptional regulator [Actinoplanes sp. NPDC051851]|uniref:TetR/AcrR family transcriptional regulator n=1 Tax=Actinoplanes sp. NPDC051851 TaxID=3154753 RepID=UPI00343014D8
MPDFTDSVWTRPPRVARGEQPTLSREQIVRAAIALLDAEGLAGLSMRKLGTSLGSGATSLYWYVATKDDLLELAIDEVMAEIYVPEAGDTSWRTGASVYATSMRAALVRHPWVLGLLGTRPTFGPNAMRLGDRCVALLTHAGFSGMSVSYVGSLLSSHAIGSATTEAAFHHSAQRAGLTPAEMVGELEPYLSKVGAEYPVYDRWRRENGPAGPDPNSIMEATFAFGLDRILDGLDQWRTTHPAEPSAPATADGG